MEILVELPDNLSAQPEPGRKALEAVALAGYRSGALTAYETRVLLGIQTRSEFDGFLKLHEMFDRSYGVEDLMDDAHDLDR